MVGVRGLLPVPWDSYTDYGKAPKFSRPLAKGGYLSLLQDWIRFKIYDSEGRSHIPLTTLACCPMLWQHPDPRQAGKIALVVLVAFSAPALCCCSF